MSGSWLWLVAIAVQVGGCTTTLSDRAGKIRWASSQSQIAGCQFLGIVEGSSTQSGVANISNGRNNARNEALESAAKKGATHVHWLTNDESFSGIHYTAEAFDCKAQEEVADEEETPRRRATSRVTDDEDSTESTEPVARKKTKHEPKETDGESSDQEQTPNVSLGSCFFVSADGIAVTNRHVVDGAQKLIVIDASGAKFPATVLRASPDSDLVALDIPTATKHASISIDTVNGLKLGDPIFTIGFPYATYLGSDPKFADGAVSGLKGFGDERLLQVTIPVQPGNSGGPVATDSGVVVGVVVAKLDALKTLKNTGSLPENVNFAIKASELTTLLRGVNLSKTKRTTSRADAITRVREASCQVVAFLANDKPERKHKQRDDSDFDCETDGCPDGKKCEIKSGLCREQ